ncbi:MAG TPA: DUF2065 family protein [Mizugakiibacter sp.]|nr:DUF2065 family protein [Mizugakiibacter sp.]
MNRLTGEFGAALCLVVIIEGLVLLVIPRLWQRMAAEAQKLSTQHLRITGLTAVALGLIGLHWLR